MNTPMTGAKMVIDPASFDASSVSVEQAYQWGRYAFQQDGADVATEDDLMALLPELLDQKMPSNWSMGFTAGFVSAFLDEQRCFISRYDMWTEQPDQQETPR
jgi:hypothetical protein